MVYETANATIQDAVERVMAGEQLEPNMAANEFDVSQVKTAEEKPDEPATVKQRQ